MMIYLWFDSVTCNILKWNLIFFQDCYRIAILPTPPNPSRRSTTNSPHRARSKTPSSSPATTTPWWPPQNSASPTGSQSWGTACPAPTPPLQQRQQPHAAPTPQALTTSTTWRSSLRATTTETCRTSPSATAATASSRQDTGIITGVIRQGHRPGTRTLPSCPGCSSLLPWCLHLCCTRSSILLRMHRRNSCRTWLPMATPGVRPKTRLSRSTGNWTVAPRPCPETPARAIPSCSPSAAATTVLWTREEAQIRGSERRSLRRRNSWTLRRQTVEMLMLPRNCLKQKQIGTRRVIRIYGGHIEDCVFRVHFFCFRPSILLKIIQMDGVMHPQTRLQFSDICVFCF